MKIFLSIVFIISFFTSAAFASDCSATYDTNASPALIQFIKDLNPFWGTWRGSYKGEPVVGEFYLDKEYRFNIRGNYKTTVLNDTKIRLCYRNKKFQAIASGITLNIEVVNNRTLRVTNFLIDGAITVQR